MYLNDQISCIVNVEEGGEKVFRIVAPKLVARSQICVFISARNLELKRVSTVVVADAQAHGLRLKA